MELNGPNARVLVDAKIPKVGMHTLTLGKNKVRRSPGRARQSGARAGVHSRAGAQAGAAGATPGGSRVQLPPTGEARSAHAHPAAGFPDPPTPAPCKVIELVLQNNRAGAFGGEYGSAGITFNRTGREQHPFHLHGCARPGGGAGGRPGARRQCVACA
jgi:hypothetical protein